jgi:RHS repeat-associated protein
MNLNVVKQQSGVIPVGDPDALAKLAKDWEVTAQHGYFYTYVTNRSMGKVNFDNLTIRHWAPQVRVTYDYYPYGLAWENPQLPNAQGGLYDNCYQDKEFQFSEFANGHGLALYDFHARMYDPATGRWLVPDPAAQFANPYLAMGNNPVVSVDPDGRFMHILVGALVGGVVNLAFHADQIDSFAEGLAAFGIGATAGALGAATFGAVAIAGGAAVATGSSLAFTGVGGALATGMAGAVSGGVSTMVQGIGNNIVFGDDMPSEQDMLIGIAGNWNPWYNDGSAVDFGSANYMEVDAGSGMQNRTFAGKTPQDLPVEESVGVAKGVSKVLNGVDEVIANPSLIEGKSLTEVQSACKNTTGWVEGTLTKGRSAGQGWTFRQLNSSGGDFSDLYIQYSLGSTRHFGGAPYWKVSSGTGGTQWFVAGQ